MAAAPPSNAATTPHNTSANGLNRGRIFSRSVNAGVFMGKSFFGLTYIKICLSTENFTPRHTRAQLKVAPTASFFFPLYPSLSSLSLNLFTNSIFAVGKAGTNARNKSARLFVHQLHLRGWRSR
jgi:hypothetical protein